MMHDPRVFANVVPTQRSGLMFVSHRERRRVSKRPSQRLLWCAFAVLTMSFVSLGPVRTSDAGANGYKVVVSPANPVSSLSRQDVSALFLGKMRKWPDGSKAVPVDQSGTSAVRAVFTQDIHGKSVDGVINHWRQLIFTGQGTPPPVKGGDEHVVAFVGNNPSAIGYVSTEAETTGVKVLTLAE